MEPFGGFACRQPALSSCPLFAIVYPWSILFGGKLIMKIFALLAGLALLVLAPMISANEEGQNNKPEQVCLYAHSYHVASIYCLWCRILSYKTTIILLLLCITLLCA